ncbi:MAG: phospholipid carrier-dependent glycosyltransferase [Actinomycetia bacterium]|nr:phospholipid carrier-dependent glycosyltransferase [Actinomycetes bacterium]
MTTTADAAAPTTRPVDPDAGSDDLPVPRPPLRDRLVPPLPDDGWWGWLGPLAVAALAAVLRLVNLGFPHVFSWDETYYAKDALGLLQGGFEQETVPQADQLILDGRTDVFTGNASYVVHPPVGKWVIAAGQWLVGPEPLGWRLPVALLGTLTVLMVARIGRRLFRSTLLGCLAGLLLALDGLSLVVSRTALLDGILAFFVVAAFGALLVDRDRARRRLADWAESHGPPLPGDPGPRLGLRPWRVAAGVALGLACGTKWSGLWFVAVFGVLTVLWDAGARHACGVRQPLLATARRDAVPAFLSTVVVAVGVYLASWSAWLVTYPSQSRTWTLTPGGPGFLPERLRALIGYHQQQWGFHTNLESAHAYAAEPAGWILMLRPTAFFTETVERGEDGCLADSCTREITALGTPVLWWAAAAALLWLLWRWLGGRDWRAGAVLAGVAAGWLPWVLLYRDRTVFTTYATAFAPFLVLGLAMALGRVLGPPDGSPRRRAWGAAAVGAFVLVVLANAAWLWPVWVADQLPYDDWLRRMWFRGWI